MRKGISLIEIIISIVLIMIIITPIILFFNKTIDVFHAGNPSYKVFSVVNDAMNEITDTLRQAKNIGISEETEIGFIIPINDGEEEMKIIFKADTSNYLIEREDDYGKSYVPYYNNPETPDEEKVLLKLTFTYYDENGNEIPYGNPDKVRMVKIIISGISAIDPNHTSRIDMTNMVKLRNIK